MAEVVELAVVVPHVAVILGGNGDLVGDPPADDAGVVVVLDDQLFHLADGVGAAVGHVLRDVRDLGPDDHAHLIAEVIEVLVMLVVGQADGVRAQLLDELHVLVVHLSRDGVAQALAVLMAGDTVQRVRAAIEEEALLGVHREAAHAEALADFIDRLAVLHQADDAGVQVGVADAVPQVGMLHRQGGVAAFASQHFPALGVEDGDGDLALTADPGLNADVSVGALHGRGDLHAGAAEVIQRDVILADHQQADRAVDAAIEGEVGFLGVDKVIFAVVGDDGQLVLLFQQSGDVRPEGGEAAVVVGNLGAVQADLGAVAHTLELQPDLLGSGVKSGGREAGFIGAAAAPVVVAAILAVDVVPGMGQVDRDGFAIRAGELPVFHQRGRASHSVPP